MYILDKNVQGEPTNANKYMNNMRITSEAVSKYPEVKRDFALLLDKKVKFEEIKQLAKKTEKQYLKEVNIFDIYVNEEKLGKDKKSYAVSFTFQDPEATFTDARIDKFMNNLRAAFEKNLNAQIR